jgi:peptide deformylase
MDNMKILLYPDPALRKKAEPIREITEEVRQKAEEMVELMYEAEGIGLAATQVGWPVKLLVKDAPAESTGGRIFINPVITHREGETLEEEGCLSLPGVFGKIPRAERVAVVAYNLQGERLEIDAEGVAARVWQHEIDHFSGILILDKMTPASSMASSRRLKEMEADHRERAAGSRIL